jgi:hypothetical protein
MLFPSGSRNNGAHFGETAWSVVLAAGNVSESRAHEALAELCQMYWPPIYAYLRQRGFNRDDAQDLTQIFFQRIVQDETLRRASPARGRFRSFLLGALTRCLADEQAYLRAVKRGGGAQFISMDEVAAEEVHHQRVTMNLTPADSLDARWAGLLLERALDKVRTEFSTNGKAETFDALSPFLAGEKPGHFISGCCAANGIGDERGQNAYSSVAPAIRQRRATGGDADGERPARSG